MPDRVEASLQALYREVDRIAGLLHRLHGDRLRCRKGCADCCIDGITVFEVEAHYILKHCSHLFRAHSAHPSGACAFLDPEGSCRIYPFRPYVCRTQGLPLRWIDEDQHPSPVEMRDICPLNDPGPPIVELPPDACWSIGPFEARLAGLQREMSGGSMGRVRLRDLFEEGQPVSLSGGHT
ncbi:MAG: YkgJ family cysteine cluster protein [Pseudomonadota bacterium]|nr:YkgJ family cysteine cluster protein [Pseudomonadota bacterium]HON39112.1 YkgJ family cysteine cluster protein [Deltaproteobacteria bacterium]HPX18160.1 YkgJ family cysteine cluster protein [Deltaproteobacteria bacterium]